MMGVLHMWMRKCKFSQYVLMNFMGIGIWCLAFGLFLSPIAGNRIAFMADEMYWIQTGRIVQILGAKDWNDAFWDEYWGYTNFNGGKLLYGVGLRLLGGTTFEPIGLPPETYSRFKAYDGNPFPVSHELYSMLWKGRAISAFFGALAVAVTSLYIWTLTKKMAFGLAAGVLLMLHPGFWLVATHALADSSFLFFWILFLFLLERFRGARPDRLVRYVVYGSIVAITTSIKVNGILLLLFFGLYEVLAWRRDKIFLRFGIILCSFVIVFALFHPNFFFYPKRTPITILNDRVRITLYHMQYFGQRNPGHVLWSVGDRVVSSVNNIFQPRWLAPIFVIFLFWSLYRHIRLRTVGSSSCRVLLLVLITYIPMLGYVVFDEVRYFLPMLPVLYAALFVGLSN